MPNIPTIPGYAYAQTPSGGAQASMAGPSAIAQGVASLGGAVQNVSNVLFEYKQKKQHAIDMGAITKFDLASQKAQMEFAQRVASDPELKKHPQDIPKEWQNVVSNLQTSIAGRDYEGVSPLAKKQLTNAFQQWNLSTSGHFTQVSDAIKFQDIKQDSLASADLAANNGDMPKAEGIIDAAISTGAMFPNEKPKIMNRLGVRADESSVDMLINESPKSAIQALEEPKNFPYLTGNQRRSWHIKASNALNASQGIFTATIVSGLLERKPEAIAMATDDNLNEAVRSGTLSEKSYKQIITIKKSLEQQDTRKADQEIKTQKAEASSHFLSLTYDRTFGTEQEAEKAFKEDTNDARWTMLDEKTQAMVKHQYLKDVKINGKTQKMSGAYKIIANHYANGRFGDIKDKAGMEQAASKLARLNASVSQFVSEHPQATADEITQYTISASNEEMNASEIDFNTGTQ